MTSLQSPDEGLSEMDSAQGDDSSRSLLSEIEAEAEQEESSLFKQQAVAKIQSLLHPDWQVGDLIRMDFNEAHVLVHDAMRQLIGGLPHGCLLLATRTVPKDEDALVMTLEVPSLLLLRVLGSSSLPNDIEMQQARLMAGQRASDSPHNWDEQNNTDQFTLNQMRYAGLRCSVVGTYRTAPTDGVEDCRLTFGGDIENFYAGQGMKVYKPVGDALETIVNFTKGGEAGDTRVPIGEIKYAAALGEGRPESVRVRMTTRDVIAQRTALFGMTRTGKSNTVKTLASAVFQLRLNDAKPEKVGQLIIDPNGEYANENPQDGGCLRNVAHLPDADPEDVVTYGLTPHPHDKDRKITKVNFFGQDEGSTPPASADELNEALRSLLMGKQILDGRLAQEGAGYIAAFRSTDLVAPPAVSDRGDFTRYRRALFVYRAILAAAGYSPPNNHAQVRGLFGEDVRGAMRDDDAMEGFVDQLGEGWMTWEVAADFCRQLHEWFKGQGGRAYDRRYQASHEGRSWSDERLLNLLRIFENTRGVQAIRECREWHDPSRNTDYTDDIVEDLGAGRLVILDQALGDPEMNEQSAESIMQKVFARQQYQFTHPPKGPEGELLDPDPVIIYVEEAHTLLPRGNEQDTRNIWARVAKEGAKFNIGLVYSTQEPSTIQGNILRNTENWFISHLNSTGETRELDRYNDFSDFTDSIRRVKEPGFLKVRMMSSPYTLPVQIDPFSAPKPQN